MKISNGEGVTGRSSCELRIARVALESLLSLMVLIPTLARAEVPDGYRLVFQSGFNPGVTVEGGDACGARRDLTGRDSVTSYSWDELPGDPSQNYFNDVIENGPPDCCAEGCLATSLDECHTIEIVSGIPQLDGSLGYALRGVLLKDCSSSSYSRIQYNMYDSNPPVGSPLPDLVAYYAELDMSITDPDLIVEQNGWLGIVENYDTNDFEWKSALLLDCLGIGDCPQFYMYNCLWGACTETQDNAITPQAGVPFKLRLWYRASTTDGLWKITYTCPSCSPPVPETVIDEFHGQTIDEGDLDVADIIKVSGTWGGVEVYWTDFLLAEPVPTDGDADGDVDADTDGDVDADADADGDTDVDGDTDGDIDGDTDGDIDGDTDGDIDGDTDGDVDGDTDGDIDGDTDGDSDSDSEGDLDGDDGDDGCGCRVAGQDEWWGEGLSRLAVWIVSL